MSEKWANLLRLAVLLFSLAAPPSIASPPTMMYLDSTQVPLPSHPSATDENSIWPSVELIQYSAAHNEAAR